MQAFKTFWNKNAVNKGIVLGLSLFIFCCGCGGLTMLFSPDRSTPPTDNTTATEEPVTIETPKDTETPEPTPIPSPTLEPYAAFEQALNEIAGRSNRDLKRITAVTWSQGDGILDIQWTINDNLTGNLIMAGAQTDVTDMLEFIATNGAPYPYQEITFDGTFSLVDQFGNVSEERVILASYKAETIQKINWDNFLFDNIFNIADGGAFIHPAMLK